ncbi:uncharacterized protein LOC131484637 [Neofelis nebulosa]|uniref:uncharacterized protein LOC131484637 n=1 Tax=Neofelis nebulosa TaxID=61452 RepID=UPI00272A5BBD|nr:uncharacterized protein LOC131484637 [Neofelis nebulosa]
MTVKNKHQPAAYQCGAPATLRALEVLVAWWASGRPDPRCAPGWLCGRQVRPDPRATCATCLGRPRMPPTPGRLLHTFPGLWPLWEHANRCGGRCSTFPAAGGRRACIPRYVPLCLPVRSAPPLLSSNLALWRERLYDPPWYSKPPARYPVPQLPREVPHFLNSSHEYTGATSEGLGHTGGRRDSGQCRGPEIFMPPPAANASR